jgi:hypothetical protein
VSPPVSAEELSRRAAAAEAAAAELLAAESAEKAERARKDLWQTNRGLKRQKRRLQKLEAALVKTRGSECSDADDAGVDGLLLDASVEDRDDPFDEPDWLADLLEDFDDAGTDATSRRSFVENSVRTCASLRLQLETVQRCVVCLDGARGTILVPCGHTGLCRWCAVRVAEAPVEARRCPVCLQGMEGWNAAFI